uniref:Uncharacterized protein n=1 Tax=Globodera rostochiensis TaxID=31243 RepID=A0A914HS38_GLORO
MEEFLIIILAAFFATNSLDKAESVKLELKTFDEIFGEGWWDKDKAAEDLKMPALTNFGQNVHHQIDRQKTQIGQIEPNSTDQLGQIEPNSTDQLGQIESNSTDQNPPLTESDHSDNAKNEEDLIAEDEQKAESVQLEELEELPLQTFDELFVDEWWDKDEAEDFTTDQNPHTKSDHSGQMERNSTDQNPPLTESDHSGQIEPNSTDQNPPLTESDHSGQIEPNSTNQNPPLTESDHSENAKNGEEQNKVSSNENIAEDERKQKFDQRKAELMRYGFKNSYNHEIDQTVAKELGLSFMTIYNWKRELGQTTPTHKYSQSEQKELLKRYYEIKNEKPKISDKDIAKMLKIGRGTLFNWKKQFKRQQFHQNSVDGHSVEENAAARFKEIENSNLGSI